MFTALAVYYFAVYFFAVYFFDGYYFDGYHFKQPLLCYVENRPSSADGPACENTCRLMSG